MDLPLHLVNTFGMRINAQSFASVEGALEQKAILQREVLVT